MTSQGPQLTPPGGVHLLRLPGGARAQDQAPERATAEQLALSPFSEPAPGLIMPSAPGQSGAHALPAMGVVLQHAPSSVPPGSEVGDWALAIVALLIVATGIAWRATRRR